MTSWRGTRLPIPRTRPRNTPRLRMTSRGETNRVAGRASRAWRSSWRARARRCASRAARRLRLRLRLRLRRLRRTREIAPSPPKKMRRSPRRLPSSRSARGWPRRRAPPRGGASSRTPTASTTSRRPGSSPRSRGSPSRTRGRPRQRPRGRRLTNATAGTILPPKTKTTRTSRWIAQRRRRWLPCPFPRRALARSRRDAWRRRRRARSSGLAPCARRFGARASRPFWRVWRRTPTKKSCAPPPRACTSRRRASRREPSTAVRPLLWRRRSRPSPTRIAGRRSRDTVREKRTPPTVRRWICARLRGSLGGSPPPPRGCASPLWATTSPRKRL